MDSEAGAAVRRPSAEPPSGRQNYVDSWWSIPPGMTTHRAREPDGEWVHLACRTQIAADGIGLCHGEFSDVRGSIGEVAQPLLVRAR